MKFTQSNVLRALALAAAWAFCPAGTASAADKPWTLENVCEAFENTRAAGNSVCLMHDGWKIVFLSHNKRDIGAILITQRDSRHEHNLRATIQRLVDLTGLNTPAKLEMEDHPQTAAIVIDSELVEELGDEADHVFSGSPLEGIAYLMREGYFYIFGVQPNGYMHWKTVKISGVDLLMPMAPLKLSAMEVTGDQKMDEYATEVLARKLGLGSNTASLSQRRGACGQLNCSEVTYMNSKRNVVGARLKRRFVIGKRTAAANMLAERYNGDLVYPPQASNWPGAPAEELKDPPPPQIPQEEPVRPLTPKEAQESYKELLRKVTK